MFWKVSKNIFLKTDFELDIIKKNEEIWVKWYKSCIMNFEWFTTSYSGMANKIMTLHFSCLCKTELEEIEISKLMLKKEVFFQ